jgi:tetratricopeptide (TPR) repeat protein
MLFLSEEFHRVEGLQKAINNPGADGELASPAGLMLALAGVAYDPSADDWKLENARQLYTANAYSGAGWVAAQVNPRSVFAPEASLLRAYVALRGQDKSAATSFAQTAMRAAADRFDIVVGAAQVLDEAEQDAPAIAAFDAALRIAPAPKDRATALISRGFTHRHFGRIDAAVADARAALDADRRNEGVRIAAIAILMDNPGTWGEAVSLGRELLRENPDSVTRLNQLGYTLIHREEGLEEGIILLHRGASVEPSDYAVVDSLGWAYYLYGDFEEARRLIERANELTGDDPNAEILDHLGDVYWRLDRKDDARTTWRQALDAKPELQRRSAIEVKLREGLTSPAPVKRPLPALGEIRPRERQDI